MTDAIAGTNPTTPLAFRLCVLEVPEAPWVKAQLSEKTGVELQKEVLAMAEKPKTAATETEPPSPTTFSSYLDKLHIKVLKGAYVLLMKLTKDAAPDPKSAPIYCRTNDAGELKVIPKGKIEPLLAKCGTGKEELAAGDEKPSIHADESWGCLWSIDPLLFVHAVFATRIAEERKRALSDYPFFKLELGRFPMFHKNGFAGVLEEHDDDTPRRLSLELLLHDFGAAAPEGQGLVRGYDLAKVKHHGGKFDGESDPYTLYVFARRPAIASMYLCELLSQEVVRIRQDSAWHYSTLHEAMDAAEAAERMRSSDAIDKKIAETFSDRNATPIFHKYAHDCAAAMTKEHAITREQRDRFYNAVATPSPTDRLVQSSRADADYIRDVEHGPSHPGWHDNPQQQGDPERLPIGKVWKPLYAARDAVMAYFDWYAFGFSMKYLELEVPGVHGEWQDAVREAEEGIAFAGAKINAFSRSILDRYAGFLDINWDIARSMDDDHKTAMWARYGAVATALEASILERVPEAEVDSSEADHDTKPAGSKVEDPRFLLESTQLAMRQAFMVSTAKHAEILKALFERSSKRYLASMVSKAKSTVEVQERLFQLVRKAKTVDKIFGTPGMKQFALELPRGGAATATGFVKANLKSGSLTITSIDGAAVEIETTFVVREKFQKVTKGKGRPKKPVLRKIELSLDGMNAVELLADAEKAEKLEAAERAGRHLEGAHAPEPFQHGLVKKKLAVPHWFATIAYGAMVVNDMVELGEALKKQKSPVDAMMKLGIDASLGIQTFSEAFHLTFGHADKLLAKRVEIVGKFAGVVGAGLEIVQCFREGVHILTSGEIQELKAEGHTTAAYLTAGKAGILILTSVGAAGAVAVNLATGASLAFAFGAAGPVLAVGAVVVVFVDLAIDIAVHWSDAHGCMQPLSERLDKALKTELGDESKDGGGRKGPSVDEAGNIYYATATSERIHALLARVQRLQPKLARMEHIFA